MMNKLNRSKVSNVVVPVIFVLLIFTFSCKTGEPSDKLDRIIEHGIVYSENGRFGGWPANHGIWTWGEEILVGFIDADFKETKGLHTYDSSSAKIKYARSKDNGRTWIIEDAFERGQKGIGADHKIEEGQDVKPFLLPESMPDFTNPNFILTFLRGNNDNGPSHFYYSINKGEKWNGPFIFPDLDTAGIATRTDYVIEGNKELSAFLTIAKSNKKEGRVVYTKTYDGGVNWEIVSYITPEQGGFDIMPSSLRLGPAELITVIRTRTEDRLDLLTAYHSIDNGVSWERLRDPVADTGRGGSPPALVKMMDGRLALAYIYRSEHGSRVNIRFSNDNGRTWCDEIVLRCSDGANRDVGYPRMVQRIDGKLLIIYYWNNANQPGKDPYRYIAYTVIDPDQWI